MRFLIAVAALSTALSLFIAGSHAAESKNAGERVKSDAKGVAHGVKDAAVSVGKQIGHGTKKAYKSTKSKIKNDVNAGKPGDGSLAAKNEKMKTAKDGRE